VNILLTHAYFLAEDAKEQEIMKPYPTLGLLYVSGYLKKHGVEHQVYDTTFSSMRAFKQLIEDTKPQMLAMYTNLMTKVKVVELMQYVRSVPDMAACKIVLGGPDVTYNVEAYLNAGADYLVIGEGEQTMLELIETLKENGDESTVQGLAFRRDGQVIQTPSRVKMKSLAELPLPNREAYPIEKYLATWKEHHGYSALNVSTQRGCPYTCKWCSTAVYGQSYRRRPAEQVVDELKHLHERYQPEVFWFVDDVFTVSHKWLKDFRDQVVSSGLQIRFECITRAERMNDEVIQWLKEAGCYRVWIGAESGSQRIIDAMDRRVDVQHVKDMLIKTREAGIETGTFIMMGYPGETMEDIKTTAKYLVDTQPDHFTITKSYPIRGTQLFEEVKHRLTHEPDWNVSTDREIDFERAYSDRFYGWAIRYMNNLVLLRKQASGGNYSLTIAAKTFVSLLMMRLESLRQV